MIFLSHTVAYEFEMPNYVIVEANTMQEVCIVRTTNDAPSGNIDINLQTQPFTASGTDLTLYHYYYNTCTAMGLLCIQY